MSSFVVHPSGTVNRIGTTSCVDSWLPAASGLGAEPARVDGAGVDPGLDGAVVGAGVGGWVPPPVMSRPPTRAAARSAPATRAKRRAVDIEWSLQVWRRQAG